MKTIVIQCPHCHDAIIINAAQVAMKATHYNFSEGPGFVYETYPQRCERCGITFAPDTCITAAIAEAQKE